MFHQAMQYIQDVFESCRSHRFCAASIVIHVGFQLSLGNCLVVSCEKTIDLVKMQNILTLYFFCKEEEAMKDRVKEQIKLS